MVLFVIFINYISWAIFHYRGLTTASFVENLITAFSAFGFVILAITFTFLTL
jgi:hypothetical protein